MHRRPHPPSAGALGPPSPAVRERGASAARRVRVRRRPNFLRAWCARGALVVSPALRRAVGEIFLARAMGYRYSHHPPVVLRGLDPRIHAFLSALRRRGWPGQASHCGRGWRSQRGG
jgi:hypothetical protein